VARRTGYREIPPYKSLGAQCNQRFEHAPTPEGRVVPPIRYTKEREVARRKENPRFHNESASEACDRLRAVSATFYPQMDAEPVAVPTNPIPQRRPPRTWAAVAFRVDWSPPVVGEPHQESSRGRLPAPFRIDG
jgi:hypothetical protein